MVEKLRMCDMSEMALSGPKTRYWRLSSRMHWAAPERHLMGAMHQDLIPNQFTRQASPFSAAAMITGRGGARNDRGGCSSYVE